jgi:hypothetical protein
LVLPLKFVNLKLAFGHFLIVAKVASIFRMPLFMRSAIGGILEKPIGHGQPIKGGEEPTIVALAFLVASRDDE